MKIILLQHVKGIGRKGEITEVSDGYAQNALIPKGLAKVATATEVNKLRLSQSSKKQKEEKEETDIKKALTSVNGKSITIKEKLTEKGTLYRALGNKDIAKEILEQLAVNIDEELFAEKYALKEQGRYILKLHGRDTDSEVHISIESK